MQNDEQQTEAMQPIDDLIERLRGRVDERRDKGEYPEGLEEALDAHFRRIVFHRAHAKVDRLRTAVSTFDERIDFEPREVAVDSGVPGGEMLHKAVNKAIARHRQVLLEQMSEFADAVRDVVHVLADSVQDPSNHVHVDLVGRLDAVLERLDSYERRPIDDAASVGDLRRRIEVLEREIASRSTAS